MNYFDITTIPQENPDLCVLRDPPADIEHLSYKMSTGKSILKDYPVDAHIRMSDDEDGIVLGGLIANTDNLFIVCREIKDLILEHDQQHDCLEILPLKIFNHKNRLASADYFIINPLGTEDCLDQVKSTIIRDKSGNVISVEDAVLVRSKVNSRKALFRPAEEPHMYFARADWLKQIKSLGLKHANVLGVKLEISE